MLTIVEIMAPLSPLPEALQQQLLQACELSYLQAERALGRQFPRPDISLALRGRSAGTAHLQLNKLRFNPILLQENPREFFAAVVPHEICHLLCYQLYGRVKPHGKEWQYLMRTLYDLTPRTTHCFDVQSVSGRQFAYHCQCGPVMLSIRRHNKVVKQQMRYRCRNCQQILAPNINLLA
ncbi:SprT family zinc-dependent metalloprotease [Shewanella sp. NIFS-20-20]|uniref:SprT family zinc-dependent metalloprotease n=1 Tax=Shewanella sp. NIFS-20-20 TaxID=2853806 RepID=UPI003527AECE